jgi:signal peptidase II
MNGIAYALRTRPMLRYLLLVLVIVALDQATKVWVKLNMTPGEEFRVLGHWFRIYFTENPGAAFGMTFTDLLGMQPDTAKLVLSLFSVVALGFIGWVLHTVVQHRTALPVCVALIFAGALGNIIDRLFYGAWFGPINQYEGGLFHGRVVDFFYIDIWKGIVADWVPFYGGQYLALWPIFNIADIAISVGIVWIFLYNKKFFPQDSPLMRAAKSEAAQAANPSKPAKSETVEPQQP